MNEKDEERSVASGEPQRATKSEQEWPKQVLVCVAVTAFAMATQNTLITIQGRIPVTAADVLAGISCLVVLWSMFRRKLRVTVPASLVVLVLAFHVAGLWARASLPGAVEAAQRTEQFFVGGVLFAVLLAARPPWAVIAVSLGIAANVLIALVQATMLSGFGPEVNGAFRSRAALDAWLLIAGSWCLPYWLTKAEGLKRVLLYIAGVAVLLGVMAHGQLLLLSLIVFSAIGFFHSNRNGVLTLAGIALFALTLVLGPDASNRRAVLGKTLSPFHEGRIKQCHTELVAAMRMAEAHPWHGIGLGHYQEWIGTFYRELPNPNVNEIETDTQSGWGILFGTAGFGVGILFALILLRVLTRGIRAWYESGRKHPLFLGGAGVAVASGAAMLITDPLIRATGWYVCLGLVSGLMPVPGGRVRPRGMSWKGVIGWGVIFALLAAGIAVTRPPTTEFLASSPLPSTTEGTEAAPAASPAPGSPGSAKAAGAAAAKTGEYKADPDVFVVVDATDAVEFTPPVIRDKDPNAARGVILRIPDEKGKPPEGAEPGMKYGGAKYVVDMPANSLCNVWVRVWWEGSCGNSLYYRHSDGTTLVVGNDGTYDAWHWLRVPRTFKFHKGKNEFYLLNREDGIRIDQILITGDLNYVPQGIEESE